MNLNQGGSQSGKVRNVSHSRNKQQQVFNFTNQSKDKQGADADQVRVHNDSSVSADNKDGNQQVTTNITNIIYNFNLGPNTTTAVQATQSLVPLRGQGIDQEEGKIDAGSQRSQSQVKRAQQDKNEKR